MNYTELSAVTAAVYPPLKDLAIAVKMHISSNYSGKAEVKKQLREMLNIVQKDLFNACCMIIS